MRETVYVFVTYVGNTARRNYFTQFITYNCGVMVKVFTLEPCEYGPP